MKRTLGLVLIVLFSLAPSLLTPADENAPQFLILEGVWDVHIAWVDPPVSGDIQISIDMVDRRNGIVSIGNPVGDFLRTFLRVDWDVNGIAFYTGRLTSRGSMEGTMANTSGNFGNWSAVKSGAGSPLSGDIGVAMGTE